MVTCVDGDALDAAFVGRPYDAAFHADLPDGVDPCGEHDEFQPLDTDGPPFESPAAVARGGP